VKGLYSTADYPAAPDYTCESCCISTA